MGLASLGSTRRLPPSRLQPQHLLGEGRRGNRWFSVGCTGDLLSSFEKRPLAGIPAPEL